MYVLCMLVFPLMVTFLFTSLMDEGQPENMPVGIVDQDNTTFTRKLTHSLDAFQTTRIVARYASFEEARQAMQHGDIYAGALLFRDLKTISTLGSAAIGQATLRAKGLTPEQIATFLQPIKVDLHTVSNPWVNYNTYLSTMLIPGCLLLFVFLITAYALGQELKMQTSQVLMKMANNNIFVALFGKMLPHMVINLAVFYFYLFYVYSVMHFPYQGSVAVILLLGFLSVVASMGFAVFMYGLVPALRMSMSLCSLWGVLSFSMVGTAFPTFAMDAPLEVLAQLFPLRHYFRLYQTCVFNGNALVYDWPNVVALLAFALLPLLVVRNLKRAFNSYVYLS